MREDIARAVAAIDVGSPATPEAIGAVRALYAPFQETEPYDAIVVTRDARYGPDERHRLDVFAPQDGVTGRPVVLFAHGGGFVGGDKRTPGTPYYDNVGLWAARHGYVGVTMTYRLAPQHPYPAGGEDVAAALRWVKANIGASGGDPQSVVLLGQSAGATHVATYGALPELYVAPGGGVRGIALLSGVYDFTVFERAPNVRAYIGDGPGAAADASSLHGLVAARIPLLLSVAEFDTPEFHAQAWRLGTALFDRDGVCPNFSYLPGHNHLSQITHLNARGIEDEILSDRLVDFFNRQTVLTPATT